MPDIYKPMGTVSHGTMLTEDLIPAFAVELEYLTKNAIPNCAYVTTYDYRTANRELVNRANNLLDYESDNADFILEELFGALNEFAMSYFYFGAHPGDGSDYGFWLHEDWEQCAKDDGVQFVEDSSQGNPGDNIAVVSDHGNVTFGYICDTDKRFHEIWSVV